MPDKQISIVYCEGNTDGTVGGSFFSLLYLVASLDKARYKPLVVFHDAHALLPQYHAAGIETLIIPAYRPTHLVTDTTPGFLRPVLGVVQKGVNLIGGFVGRALRYARLLKARKADILHLNNSIIRNHDWMLAALLTRTPCVTHERGINNHYPPLAHFIAKRLDAIICISLAVRRRLEEHGLDHGNLVTVYNGIDPEIVRATAPPDAVRERHALPADARLIGVIGNIKQWKGQETLIRALPAILKSAPDVHCLLVGDTSPADAEYRHTLERLCEQYGITDRVCFTGYTTNVADYLNVLDIVIHTSVDDEPFGRVLIEAMAMRKPLIGARGGAVPEIIVEGETGLMFTPADPESVQQAVIELLNDPQRAGAMGEAGRARLEANFDIRLNSEATVALYERLIRTAENR